MALTKVVFKPGVDRENTEYTGEGGYYACDKVRFYSGAPHKIGGWINSTNGEFSGIARSLYNWTSYAGENLLAVGTNQAYYIEYGGMFHDITPLRATATLPNNPITTNFFSRGVTINAPAHGASAGSFVAIAGATAVGGVTLSGTYEIVSVIDGNNYIIAIDTTVVALGTNTGGGAAVTAAYYINAGNSTSVAYGGWGSGGWGSGGWGSGTTSAVAIPLQLWSQTTFEDSLIFATLGGAIYYWAKDSSTWARALTLEDYANTQVATTTTATFLVGVTTITVGSSFGIRPGAVIAGTNIAAGTYVTTAYAGGTSVPISAATTGGSSGNYTFSYSGRHVPNQVNFILSSDVSRFTIALGANPYDPTDFDTDFDPMLVRWSDQLNPYQWTPQTDNQAGEQRLNNGSYLVCGVNTRQEILVWSDSALYSMQYAGPPLVWRFDMVMDHISIMSQNAVIVVNNIVYWMGKDKFYMYTGQVGQLDCTLVKYIFEDLNYDQIAGIVAGSNPGFNEVWWFYPSADSVVNDRYAIYNYAENVWTYGNLNRTAWLHSSSRGYPLGVFSIQTSYTTAEVGNNDTYITVLNGYSYPSSGVLVMGPEEIYYEGVSGNVIGPCTRGYNGTTASAFPPYYSVEYKAPNQVMLHEYGVDDQSTGDTVPIEAYIESSDFDIGDGDSFMFVWRMLPDLSFKGSTPNNPTPKVTMSVVPRQNSGVSYTTGADTPTVTRTSTYVIDQYTGEVFTRVRGRQMKFRIESTEAGVMWQLGAMRIDFRTDGRR